MLDTTIEPLTQFGMAGLMGALWTWERLLSRRRETQLTEAHQKLIEQRQALRVLTRMVRANTTALERFTQTQQQMLRLLERTRHDAHAQPDTMDRRDHADADDGQLRAEPDGVSPAGRVPAGGAR